MKYNVYWGYSFCWSENVCDKLFIIRIGTDFEF